MSTRIPNKKDLTFHDDCFRAPVANSESGDPRAGLYVFGGELDSSVWGYEVDYVSKTSEPVAGHPGLIEVTHPATDQGGGCGVFSECLAQLKDIKRIAVVASISRLDLESADWFAFAALNSGSALLEVFTGVAGAEREYENFVVHISAENSTRIEFETNVPVVADTFYLVEILVDYPHRTITFKINGSVVYQINEGSPEAVLAEFAWDQPVRMGAIDCYTEHATVPLTLVVDEYGYEVFDQVEGGESQPELAVTASRTIRTGTTRTDNK